MISRWMTPGEAAEYARVKEDTIRRWIADGHLNPVVTRDKADLRSSGAAGFVLDALDVDAYMEKRKRSMREGVEPEPEKAKATARGKAAPGGVKAFKERIRRGEG